jgi:carbamoyltransferase
MVHSAHRLSGSKNLVMAGGVALNSVANGRVMRKARLITSLFSRRRAIPVAQSGSPVCLPRGSGPAAQVYDGACLLGAEYPASQMVEVIQKAGFKYEAFDDDDDKPPTAVDPCF